MDVGLNVAAVAGEAVHEGPEKPQELSLKALLAHLSVWLTQYFSLGVTILQKDQYEYCCIAENCFHLSKVQTLYLRQSTNLHKIPFWSSWHEF